MRFTTEHDELKRMLERFIAHELDPHVEVLRPGKAS